MRGRRHTPEQIVRRLRDGDRLLGEGKDLAEVAKQLQIEMLQEISRGNF